MTASDRDAARGATESDADGSRVVGDTQEAREARYREANGSVVAVMAVADAELEQACAENERLREVLADVEPEAFARGVAWAEGYDGETPAALLARATAAESALTEAREQVEREAESHARLAIRHREVRAERDEAREQLSRLQAKYEDAIRDGIRAADRGFDLGWALVSEREAHAGLRARLEAEVEQAWESSSHWKARAERLQELRGTAEDRVSDLAEELSRFRADVEALADDWDLYDEPCGETLRAALAAEPAEATASRPPETSGAGSIAPVDAEEGGEQEAGEAKPIYAADGGYVIRKDNLDDLRAECARLAGEALAGKRVKGQLALLGEAVTDLCWKATPMGETSDGDVHAYILPKGTVHRLIGVAQSVGINATFRALPAPSGSDEQGNRTATPDANGVHDTKGGESR